MSGAGEPKWRRGSQTPSNNPPSSLRGRQSGQTSGTNTPNPDTTKRQSLSSASGNTWDRSRSGSAAGSQQRGGTQGGQAGPKGGVDGPNAAPAMVQEEHVPVNGFNADEVKAFLSTASKETKAPVWKPAGETKSVKSGSPWGSKPTQMASGQDFWVQLRKQITNLEQGKAG